LTDIPDERKACERERDERAVGDPPSGTPPTSSTGHHGHWPRAPRRKNAPLLVPKPTTSESLPANRLVSAGRAVVQTCGSRRSRSRRSRGRTGPAQSHMPERVGSSRRGPITGRAVTARLVPDRVRGRGRRTRSRTRPSLGVREGKLFSSLPALAVDSS
jgi:hypothetical protein